MSIFNRSITTLNFESDSIRIVNVQNNRVNTFGELAVPGGVITHGVIQESGIVVKLINDLYKQTKVPRRNTIVSMNCFRSVARIIVTPVLGGARLKEAVKWAAEREMPVPLETINIWWKVISKTENEQRVLLVGVPRDSLVSLYSTLYNAGISPRAVDIKAIALARTVKADRAVIADIESDTISVIVKSGGIPVIMRSIVLNPERTEIEDQVLRLKDELVRTIDFYNSGNPDAPINSENPVYVTGAAFTGKVSSMIEETVNKSVALPDPEIGMPEGFDVPKYMVNLGLYLREVKTRRSILHPDMSRADRFFI